jgi:outer membrane protein assembly complex protein YaeT
MRLLAGVALVIAALAPVSGRAAQLAALDLSRRWQVGSVSFRGNDAIRSRTLREAMLTRPRPWYTPWRTRPEFDPITFQADLRRLRQLYRSHGYYEADITYDLIPVEDEDRIDVGIAITEGEPVRVASVDVDFEGEPIPDASRRALLDALPLEAGDVFTQDDYDRAFASLTTWYREHGFARVEVTKKAVVDVETHTARVTYRADSGPPSVFGEVRIEGPDTIDRAVVRRELAFARGDPFRQSAIQTTRNNLVALHIFRSVRIDEDDSRKPVVDLTIHLVEAPPREIRLGVGYDTDEGPRGLAAWRHYDFLGGARQLGFSARVSEIRQTIAADFLQPHFPGRRNRTLLLFLQQREDEQTYTLDRTRVSPRIDWRATPTLTGYGSYRIEYDSLGSVTRGVRARIPGIAPPNGYLSGVALGLAWNSLDDVLYPHRGWVTNLSVEPVGGALGGSYSFVRVIGEVRRYHPLVRRLVGAARLRLGSADPFGGSQEIPIFERFYAGGINSVRGYGRRRLGLLVHDDPVGGRSLVETSVELQHPVTESIEAAVFLDGGQLSLDSWDFPFGDLRYGTGFGARYRSPVGPLRVDVGFPIQSPPNGDARWQFYVSIGGVF